MLEDSGLFDKPVLNTLRHELSHNRFLGLPQLFDESESSDLDDVNGTGNETVESTFTSRHYKGVKYFDDLNCINPHYAQYLGTSTIFPQKNAQTGDFEGNYAVCRTGNAAAHYLGLFNMKIYIEGWDHSVVDAQLQNKLYLGLTLEINIVK